MIVRRHARPVPLARTNLRRLQARLSTAAPTSWPRHLAKAFEILAVELRFEEQRARDLVSEAVAEANACARAVDSRVTARSQEEARDKAGKALARLRREGVGGATAAARPHG